MSLVTIASYDDLASAYVARSKLEASGIFCALGNEYLVGVQWLYSNAVGGVELRVNEEDAPAALELLAEQWEDGPVSPEIESEPESATPGTEPEATPEGPHSEPAPAFPAYPDEPPDPSYTCPRCGSPDTEERNYGRSLTALGILIGIPLPIFCKRQRCNQCKYKWKPGKG